MDFIKNCAKLGLWLLFMLFYTLYSAATILTFNNLKFNKTWRNVKGTATFKSENLLKRCGIEFSK